ncbi:Lipase, class 3 (fragment) [mine drainage metagenome]|uniref:Lipase, class 3 n=1 Tax=mine drainage metagenome TaxID=410659 RepID=A0A3P3ZR02_9ZZZZ
MCLAGFPPKFVFAYEPPRLTTDNVLENLLDAHGVQSILTRNGNDIITQAPSWMRQTERLKLIGTALYPFDNLADHYISNVIKSIRALDTPL